MVKQSVMKMEIPKMPKEFWDDDLWAEDHYSALVEKYPDQWVAVVDKKVISFGKDLGLVEEEARMKTGKKYISITYVECGHHVY